MSPVGSQNLDALSTAGVSVWLDDLSRSRLIGAEHDGSLARLIATANVVGVTTNPTIFANAVRTGSDLYDVRAYPDVDTAVRELTCTDVQLACDLLRPLFDENGDGRVSIEVDPRLAHDTDGTVAEARELWDRVDRSNLYIKVPATEAGLPAIRTLLADGISVNVTLIFSLARYRDVVRVFQEAIDERRKRGLSLDGIASVASFFVSRVDTEIDRRIDALNDPDCARLRGQAAIANARLAYRHFQGAFGPSFTAPIQRPLWASTGVKDPAYRDTRYVEDLIAPMTVNTMPESTLRAFADHGNTRPDTAATGYADAEGVFADLAAIGIDYDEVIGQLEREGVSKFIDSWQELLATVRTAREQI